MREAAPRVVTSNSVQSFCLTVAQFLACLFVLILLQESLLGGHRANKARWVTQVAHLRTVKVSIAQARTGRRAPQAATRLIVM